MADTELLPCPFCGSTEVSRDAWESLTAEGPGCDECGATAATDADWNRRATPPSPSTATEVGGDPLAGLQRFGMAKLEVGHPNHYVGEFVRLADVRAALASRPAEVDDEGLPPEPESKFCTWLKHGQVVNVFPHGVGDKERWDHDGYWSKKGFHREPLFTAEQYRQGQRDAVAAYKKKQAALQELADQAQENGMGYGDAVAADRARRGLDLLDAAEAILEVLDSYPEQLVPINRMSATVTRLRESVAQEQFKLERGSV